MSNSSEGGQSGPLGEGGGSSLQGAAAGIKTIGKYEIQRVLGQGAMGIVYLGRDLQLDRLVAVKTLSAEQDQTELLARFQVEARAIAKLNHENVAAIYDCDVTHKPPYFAMEFVDGNALDEILAAQGPLPVQPAVDLVVQMCAGLSAAHKYGLTHRDIKPSNILISHEGSAKIADFGIVHAADSNLTSTGMMIGTPHYMSPEQVQGTSVDTRSDIFSLGAVAYEMLTGQKAFDGDGLPTIILKIMNGDWQPASQVRPDLPPGIDDVLRCAMAINREQRFASSAAFAEALRAYGSAGRPASSVGEAATLLPDGEAATVMTAVPAGAAPGVPPVSTHPRQPQVPLPQSPQSHAGLSQQGVPTQGAQPGIPVPGMAPAPMAPQEGHAAGAGIVIPVEEEAHGIPWPFIAFSALWGLQLLILWLLVRSETVPFLSNLFTQPPEVLGIGFMEGIFASVNARLLLVAACAGLAFQVVDKPWHALDAVDGTVLVVSALFRCFLALAIILAIASALMIWADPYVDYW